MPLIPLALVLLILLVLPIALPISLVQRYRMGTARRRGRRWVAGLSFTMLAFSCSLFICAAALSNFWAPSALVCALLGLVGGGMLGLFGLFLTRWEHSSGGLYYTPNHWLILLLTLAVTARLIYGIWKAWHAWAARSHDTSWLAAAGVAGSLAVGGVVLGYYLIYTAGLYRRISRAGRGRAGMKR